MSEPVRLMLGDCLERMAEIEDGSVDLVLADLPYGTTACKWDVVIPFEPLWAHYRRLLKPRGAVVLTASQPFTSMLVMSNPKWFRYEWVWRKNAGSNFGVTKWQPMKEHETILVFYDAFGTYNAQMERRRGCGAEMVRAGIRSHGSGKDHRYLASDSGYDTSTRDPDKRVPSSVIEANRERGLHPTQKPVALMEYLARTYSNEGETVLDNAFGSCTTGVACVNTGRNFIGIEKDPRHFEIGRRRVAEAEAKMALFSCGMTGSSTPDSPGDSHPQPSQILGTA